MGDIDIELQRMVDFLVDSARERVGDDAPVAPEAMDAIREAARAAHAAWKAKTAGEHTIVLTGLSVGGVTIEIDESFDADDLDEVFSGDLEQLPKSPKVDEAAEEKKREERWKEAETAREERAQERRESTLSTRIVLGVILFVVVVGGVTALMAFSKEKHEPTHHDDKAEMKR